MFQICVGYHIYGFKDDTGVLNDLKDNGEMSSKLNENLDNSKGMCLFNEIYESNKPFLYLSFLNESTSDAQQGKKIGFK